MVVIGGHCSFRFFSEREKNCDLIFKENVRYAQDGNTCFRVLIWINILIKDISMYTTSVIPFMESLLVECAIMLWLEIWYHNMVTVLIGDAYDVQVSYADIKLLMLIISISTYHVVKSVHSLSDCMTLSHLPCMCPHGDCCYYYTTNFGHIKFYCRLLATMGMHSETHHMFVQILICVSAAHNRSLMQFSDATFNKHRSLSLGAKARAEDFSLFQFNDGQ